MGCKSSHKSLSFTGTKSLRASIILISICSFFCAALHAQPFDGRHVISKEQFINGIETGDKISLINQINDTRSAQIDLDVKKILLDIFHNGKLAIQNKQVDASSEDIRVAAAAALLQSSHRNEERELEFETAKYLRSHLNSIDERVSIEAISGLIVLNNSEDMKRFSEIAKLEDKRFRMAVIALAASCDSVLRAQLLNEIQGHVSSKNAEFIEQRKNQSHAVSRSCEK